VRTESSSKPTGAERRPGRFSTRDGARLNLGGSYELGFGRFAADLGYRIPHNFFFKDYTGGPFRLHGQRTPMSGRSFRD